MLIKLTARDDTVIYLNSDRITSLEEYDLGTLIIWTGQLALTVQESPMVIMGLVNTAVPCAHYDVLAEAALAVRKAWRRGEDCSSVMADLRDALDEAYNF